MLISTGIHQDLGIHHTALDTIIFIHKYQFRRSALNSSQHLAPPTQNMLVNIFYYDRKYYVNVNIFN